MTIIDVTLPPYSATGNGTDDDTHSILAAINDATNGDGLYFPKGDYLVTQTIYIDVDKVGSIMGDSALSSKIIYKSDEKGILLSINQSEGGNYLNIKHINLDGGKLAKVALKLSGIFHHMSKIQDLLVTGTLGIGILIEGEILGGQFNNISIIGGQYGVYCDDTIRLNTSSFYQLRITNTQSSALYLRNPKSSSVHLFTLFDPWIEGNNGFGIDVLGGIILRVYGGALERNAKRNADCDIKMGRYSKETTAICTVNLNGTHFSSPGENQGLVRIKYYNHGAHLKVNAIHLNAGYLVDMNNMLSNSIVQAVMPSNVFKVINGPAEKVFFWP